ncbi:hypothetical protein GP486_001231, partial [Trichoglossum hirsutum]
MSDPRPTLWGTAQAETFVKTVALLRQLNDTPASPAENSIEDFAARLHDQAERSMTITQERDLVEYLSFLTAPTRDPKRVTAVCVEESDTGGSMTVRLAANYGDLGAAKEGLEKIAEVLTRAENEDHGSAETVDVDVERRHEGLSRLLAVLAR